MASANEKFLDEYFIKSLLLKERYYRDSDQWQKLRSCYHPDPSKTHVEISWFQGDIDGFVNGSRKMATGGTGAVHTICPIEIHLNGDKALTESTGSILIRFEYQGKQYDCLSFTRFISRLEKFDGEWKLLTLEAIYDRDSITSVLPSAPVDFGFAPGSRESYKCIGWLLSQRGFKIKQDLPGLDNPSSCVKFMDESFRWLNE